MRNLLKRLRTVHRRPAGYALATILILLGVALFGAGAIVTISILEGKISRSQQEGIRAYYVAEAGVQDALWRLNTVPAYSDALVTGTLNVTYTTTDVPEAGEGYTVTLLSHPTLGTGYGTVEVVGSSNNGYFTAKRQVKVTVFQGQVTSPIGNAGVYAGGSASITNGAAQVHVNNADLYANQGITVNHTNVNLGSGWFETPGNYVENSSTIISGGTHAANLPPAATPIPAPGIDCSYYRNHYDQRFSNATAFQNFMAASGSTKTLPGPVTFVDGNSGVQLNNNSRNKTLNVTGMLIFNNNLTITGAASGFTINVADPGNGKAGIFVCRDFSNSSATMNIAGVVYASGNMTFTVNQGINVDGAFISGGNMNLNVGLPMQLVRNPTRIVASFGAGAPLNVEVQHWEEEY